MIYNSWSTGYLKKLSPQRSGVQFFGYPHGLFFQKKNLSYLQTLVAEDLNAPLLWQTAWESDCVQGLRNSHNVYVFSNTSYGYHCIDWFGSFMNLWKHVGLNALDHICLWADFHALIIFVYKLIFPAQDGLIGPLSIHKYNPVISFVAWWFNPILNFFCSSCFQMATLGLQFALKEDLKATEIEVGVVRKDDPIFRLLTEAEMNEHLKAINPGKQSWRLNRTICLPLVLLNLLQLVKS